MANHLPIGDSPSSSLGLLSSASLRALSSPRLPPTRWFLPRSPYRKEGRLGRVVPAVSGGNGRGGGHARCPGRLLHGFTTAGSHCLRDWPVSLPSTPLPWLSLSCPSVALAIPASPLPPFCRGRRCPTLRPVGCGRRPSSPLLPVCRGRCPAPPFLALLRCKTTRGGGRSSPASRYRHVVSRGYALYMREEASGLVGKYTPFPAHPACSVY